MSPQAPVCYLIHNGFISFQRQTRGIAQHLNMPIEEIVIKPSKVMAYCPLSLQLIYYYFYFKKQFSIKPCVLIASGRGMIPVVLALKFLCKEKAFAIFIQKPSFGARFFDLIIAPEHDALQGANVLHSMGAINDFSVETFKKPSPFTQALLEKIKVKPLVGVLIGGKTNKYDFNDRQHAAFILILQKMVNETEASFVFVSSRRSGTSFEKELKEKFKDNPRVFVYTSDAAYNPYFDVLCSADYLLITEDSVNMISEACFTGHPVYLLSLPEFDSGKRKSQFVQSMIKSKKLRHYEGFLESWGYTPLNEAQRLTPEVRARMAHLTS